MLVLYNRLTARLNDYGDIVLPTLARLIFSGVLLAYFWKSGLTKLGDGFFGFLMPSSGAYAQIFPKAFEATGYDTSQLGVFHWAVVTGGTLAEFVLPALIVLGLLTATVSPRHDRIYRGAITDGCLWPRRGIGQLVRADVRRIDR